MTPTNFKPTTQSDSAQIAAQLAGIYNELEQDGLYGQGLWGYLNAGTDESFRNLANATTPYVEYYNIQSTETTVYNFYRNLYIGVENANVLLDNITRVQMDSARKAVIMGQSYFLRGYYYYLLVQNFGDVVLKTIPTTDLTNGNNNFNLPRNPKKDVYAQILSDMTKADSLVLPFNKVNNTYIISKAAVEAVLARVCLSMAGYPLNDKSKYQDAYNWAMKVINNNNFSLNKSFSTLFINNIQNNKYNNNTTEGIWDAAFSSNSNTAGTFSTTGYPVTQNLGYINGPLSNSVIYGSSTGSYRVFPKLFSLFQPNDKRRDWATAPYGVNSTNLDYTKPSTIPSNSTKWWDPYSDAPNSIDTIGAKYVPISYTLSNVGTGKGLAFAVHIDGNGGIDTIYILNGGTGYTSKPTLNFKQTNSLPILDSNKNTIKVTNGVVTSIAVNGSGNKPGKGYITPYDRYVAKWRREYEQNPLSTKTACNFPIVRYADVLLMAAEAELNLTGGNATTLQYFNQVRRRAFGGSTNFDAQSLTMDTTETATTISIVKERARELCFEGLRKQDLIRWGIFQQQMQDLNNRLNNDYNNFYLANKYVFGALTPSNNFLNSYPRDLLLPIPAIELTYDYLLTQNPGW